MGMIEFSEIMLFTTKDGRKITYEQLLSDIYDNSTESRETMRTLIDQMASLIQCPADAVLLMEHIAMLMDTRVKNDDLLVKVASIVSRIVQRSMDTNNKGDSDWEIPEEEKKQLLAEAKEVVEKRIEDAKVLSKARLSLNDTGEIKK